MQVGDERSKTAAPVAEESSKSDKRRILIKRKHTEEAPSEEVAPLPAVESVATSGAVVDTHVVSPPSSHPQPERSSRCARRPGGDAASLYQELRSFRLQFPPSNPPSRQPSI